MVDAAGWGCDCDEVYPGLYIGDKKTVQNIRFLNKLGITHVLNAAEGPWEDYGFVNLNQEFFKETSIQYQGFCLWDTVGCDISPYFGPAAQFIDDGLSGGGRVMVNCQMGVSRSSALAISYMMHCLGWSAAETMTEFRRRRDVRPNDDFIDQLVTLDNENRRRMNNDSEPLRNSLFHLDDLPRLPKPWHHEFWKTVPEAGDLPFKLRHVGETLGDDFEDSVGALNSNIDKRKIEVTKHETEEKTSNNTGTMSQFQCLADLNPFIFSKTRTESESSWEYYTDSECE